jgi:hypothetical protein
MHGPEAVLCPTSRRPKLYVETSRASQPANRHGPALVLGALNGAVQAAGESRERRPEQLTGIFRTRSLVPATF